jgi:hypothetical protein
MEVMVLGKCMVQTSYGDHGQKGMVSMAKDVIDTILELYKRECLMSLLECRDCMVRQSKI